MQPSFLTLPDGRRLAYHLSAGQASNTGPCVVFLGGFRSDMTGTKALALEAHCQNRGQRFLRFDYTGHGQSSGDFLLGTIGQWKRDALDMLDAIVKGPCVLVGSSMGGWLMLLAALARPEQVVGMVGIASAPDFTQALIAEELTAEQRREIEEKGVVYVPDCYGDTPFAITRNLIEEGRNHLLLHQPIALNVPVRLVHGTEDKDVPWQISQRLLERLTSDDVTLTLIKRGGHCLSEPAQIAAICHALEEVLLSV